MTPTQIDPMSNNEPDLHASVLARAEALESLGRPIETFRPQLARLVFAGTFGLALLGVGAQAAVRYAGGWCDTSRATNPEAERWGVAVIGTAAAAAAVGLLAYVRSIASTRIVLYELGLAEVRRGRLNLFRWADVTEARDGVTRVRLVKGFGTLAPAASSSMYTLHRRDGGVLRFDADKVHGADRLAQTLRTECERRAIPWQVTVSTV